MRAASLLLLLLLLLLAATAHCRIVDNDDISIETIDNSELHHSETAWSAKHVLAGLDMAASAGLSSEKSSRKVRKHRVAVGYNANLDLIVRATDLLRLLPVNIVNESSGNGGEATATRVADAVENGELEMSEVVSGSVSGEHVVALDAPLSSRSDLQRVFAHFFSRGAAAERIVSNATLFAEIVAAGHALAAASPSEGQRAAHYFTGGNAALMARRFAAENAFCEAVLLGGHVGEQLRGLLPSNVEVTPVPGAGPADEVHLILEYAKGEHWHVPTHSGADVQEDDGGIEVTADKQDSDSAAVSSSSSSVMVAPRANRFIVVRDETNSKVKALEPFHAALQEFRPTVVVVTGLHLLDDQPSAFRLERLLAVAHRMDTSGETHDGHYHLPATVPVHLELASIANPEYMQELAALLVPRVNSLGLNEQELGALYAALAHLAGQDAVPTVLLKPEDFKDPSVETVLRALQFIWSQIQRATAGVQKDGPRLQKVRRLQRIHFHCLHFHVVLVADGSSPSTWSRWHARAVAAGSVAAARQACDKEDLQEGDIELLVHQTFEVPSGYALARAAVTGEVEGSGHYDDHDDHHHHNTTARFNPDDPVVELRDASAAFSAFVAPVCVCRVPLKTVGLGDAISAVALLRHL